MTGKYGPTVTAQEIGSWSNWVDTIGPGARRIGDKVIVDLAQ